MPISLEHIVFSTLDDPSSFTTAHKTFAWIAQAEFSSSNNITDSKKFSNLQSKAVRILLDKLLMTQLSWFNPPIHYALIDSAYLYRIKPSDFYVSFTHSQNYIACAVSRYKPIGIDIEARIVSMKVAKRFFHKCEIEWLNARNLKHRVIAIKLLWSIKEAFIKKYSVKSLMQGMQINHLPIALYFYDKLIQYNYMNIGTRANQTSCKLPSTTSFHYSKRNTNIEFNEPSIEQWCLTRSSLNNVICIVVV